MDKLADTVSRMSDRSKLGWLVLLCLAWIVPGLVGHQPWKPDEAYSFGIVHHILKSGDWVMPTLAGEPFMEKPPLYFFMAALFAKLLSPLLSVHDAARLATGLFMALTLFFAGLSGRELWGEGKGRITVLVMLGCLGLPIRAHELITDMALLAGFSIALYGLAVSRRRPLLAGLLLGTGTGIGFMSKGLIAPGIIGLTALSLPLFFQAWRHKDYLRCLSRAFVAALPWLLVWPALVYARSPELFAEWFWINNWGRFFGTVRLGPGSDHWFYLVNLPWYAWPALPIALWALWREKWARPEIQLPATAFLVMLLVLSAAADARELYALPMLLPLSLIATVGIDTLRRGAANALNWFGIMTFGFFSGLLWFFWFALMTGHPAHNAEHLLEIQPGYTPVFTPLAFAVAAIYTVSWLVVLILTRRIPRGRRALINWGAGVTLLWGIATTICLPWIDAGKSYQSMIVSLQQSLPAGYRCIAGENVGEPQRALLDYYANIVVRRSEAAGKNECELLLVQGNTGNPHQAGAEWFKLWEGARPGDNSERYWLYQRSP